VRRHQCKHRAKDQFSCVQNLEGPEKTVKNRTLEFRHMAIVQWTLAASAHASKFPVQALEIKLFRGDDTGGMMRALRPAQDSRVT
jgi:hypothetical protein